MHLSKANVIVSSTFLCGITDVQGMDVISNIQPRDYLLTVSFIGMETRALNVTIESKDITVDFILKGDLSLLDEVVVNGAYQATGYERMRSVEHTAIYAFKKNELIQIDKLTINQASNLSRQIYAKVVGLNIWESDGAGV